MKMKKLLIVLTLAALAYFDARADIVSEWYGQLPDKSKPNEICFGEGVLRFNDREYYYFSGGEGEWTMPLVSHSFTQQTSGSAVLTSTPYGYCLNLANCVLGSSVTRGGIAAGGNLIIHLIGDNVVEANGGPWGDCGISSEGSILLYGNGSLTVVGRSDSSSVGIKASAKLWIGPGVSLTIRGVDVGLSAGDSLFLKGCWVNAQSKFGSSICVDGNLDIESSIVCASSPESCGIKSGGNLSVNGSIVHALGREHAIVADTLRCSSSYLAAANGDDYYAALSVDRLFFDNCLVKAFSPTRCLSCRQIDAGDVHIGSGEYYFGVKGNGVAHKRPFDTDVAAAIDSAKFYLDGGRMQICAPGSIGITTDYFQQKSGKLEFVNTLNVSSMIAFDVTAAMAYTGLALYNDFELQDTVYSQLLADFVQNWQLLQLSGGALAGVRLWYGTDCPFVLDGGTFNGTWPTYGAVSDAFTINGGAFYGKAFTTDLTEIDIRQISGGGTGSGSGAGTGTGEGTGTEAGGGTESGTGTGSGTGGGTGTDTGSGTGGGGTLPTDVYNLKLDYFYPCVLKASGYTSRRTEFADDECVYYSLNIVAFCNDKLTTVPKNIKFTVNLSNGYEDVRTFMEDSYGYDGQSATLPIGSLPAGTYTMTCTIDPNGMMGDAVSSDNALTATFEVVATRAWNFAFDKMPSVSGSAGQPIKATVTFRNETGYATSTPVECMFSVWAKGKTVGSFVKSYHVGSDSVVKVDVDLAEHMSLPMGEYELTCRLDSGSDYAETNESDNEQTVTFKVTYPTFSTSGYCDMSVPRSYQGVLLQDGIRFLGLVDIRTDGWNVANRTVKVTGTVTDVAGKKHAINGSTTVGFVIPWTLECKVDVSGYGSFDLSFGNHSDEGKSKAVFKGDNGQGVSMCSLVNEQATILLDPNGGEVDPSSIEARCGTVLGTLPTPVLSRHKFLGWYSAEEGGTKISAMTKAMGNVTYYAHWQYDGRARVDVKVADRCVDMGAVFGGKTAKGGTKVALKATAKPGYVFAGWYRDAAGEEPVEGGADYRSPSYAYVVGEDDVTFYAKFIPVAEDWVSVWCRPQDEYARGVEIEPLAVAVGSASLATVKVTGLPTGLKFTAKPLTLKATNNRAAVDLQANTIYGTPTKSGIYTATITAATAGKKSETYKVDLVVRGDGECLVDVMGIDGADYPDNGSDAQHAIQWGKMSGYGVFAPEKTATLKATANKGYVFAGWFSDVACVCAGGEEDDGCVYSPAEGTVDYRSTSFPVKVGYEDVLYYARFVRAEDDDRLWANVEDAYYLNGAWSLALDIESRSLPTVTVKGLPSGLKFNSKTMTIAGTPTKPGTYPITLSLKNATIKTARTQGFTLYVANIESPYLSGVDYTNDAYVYRVGTSMEFDIGSCATGGYAVTGVSGLPSGLKFNKNTGLITGVPTKAGPKTVTITLKNGNLTSSATITLNVDAIDTWAYGTFNGGGEDGVLTLTVGNTGKISGKWMTVDGTWTLSAKSYESYDEDEQGRYRSLVAAKCGTKTAHFWLDVCDGQADVYEYLPTLCGYGPLVATAKRNVWKEDYWESLAAQMKGVSFTLTDEVSLKVGAAGAVTATGRFVTGQNASGRDVVYSASCSTVLVPVGEDAFSLCLCFPKKDGKFDGVTLQEVLEWNGSELAIGCAACRVGF